MIAGALLQRSYGAYVVLLREEFGWSKAALSGVFSMQQIENGLLGPIQGTLLDKFGPKLTMRVGIVMFGARAHGVQPDRVADRVLHLLPRASPSAAASAASSR